MNKLFPLSRKENIVIQEIEGEILIYDLNISKAFCLNETSALIWQMCDGNNSVNDISRILAKKLNSDNNEDIVWLAIDQLKREKLISCPEVLENKFKGIPRREVIKQVGLASMIALPLITSIVAPSAIHAQSTCTDTDCGCQDSPGTGNICVQGALPSDKCTSIGCPVCRQIITGNDAGMCFAT